MVLSVQQCQLLKQAEGTKPSGGDFFLSSNTTVPPNKGVTLDIAHIRGGNSKFVKNDLLLLFVF
jgi:hypothetical protein